MAEILHGNLRIELSTDLGNRLDRSMPLPTAAFTWRWPALIEPPDALLGRDRETAWIRDAIMRRRPIEFHATCGYGVTTLLRYIAAARPGVGVAAPYLYLSMGEDPLQDILHRLVSAAFRADRLNRPTPAQSAELLGQLQAVVVIDDVRCDLDVIAYLVRAMPGCCLVLGGPHPRLAGDGASLQLTGLHDDAGLSLMALDLGRAITSQELPAARRVWAAVSGQPLHLRQAAALVRTGRHTFAELAAAAERNPEALDRLSVAALTDGQRRALGVLALLAGAMLPADLIGAMGDIAGIREALADLQRRGLSNHDEDRFGLPICKVDSYRSQLLGYVDAGSATRQLISWLTSRDPADHVSASVAEAVLSLIGFTAERGDLTTVVRLVRVVEPTLMLAGRWQACARALHQGIDAAHAIGDLASQAYFAHQLGTLALCQDQLSPAQQFLQHALQLREHQTDTQGAARTRHNLSIMQPAQPPTPPRPRTRTGPILGVATGITALLVIIASLIGSHSTQRVAATAGPARTDTSTSTAPTTSNTSTSTRTRTSTPTRTRTIVASPAAAIDPTNLSFLDAPVGTTSSGEHVNVRSVGTAALIVQNVGLRGTNAEEFKIVTDCSGFQIQPKKRCSIEVSFAPRDAGPRSAQLTITHNAPGSPVVVSLAGTGILLPDLVPEAPRVKSSGRLVFFVVNHGDGDAASSTTSVAFGSAGSFPQPTPVIPAGQSILMSVVIPSGCFAPDCSYTIAVDANNEVQETAEDNNQTGGTSIG